MTVMAAIKWFVINMHVVKLKGTTIILLLNLLTIKEKFCKFKNYYIKKNLTTILGSPLREKPVIFIFFHQLVLKFIAIT